MPTFPVAPAVESPALRPAMGPLPVAPPDQEPTRPLTVLSAMSVQDILSRLPTFYGPPTPEDLEPTGPLSIRAHGSGRSGPASVRHVLAVACGRVGRQWAVLRGAVDRAVGWLVRSRIGLTTAGAVGVVVGAAWLGVLGRERGIDPEPGGARSAVVADVATVPVPVHPSEGPVVLPLPTPVESPVTIPVPATEVYVEAGVMTMPKEPLRGTFAQAKAYCRAVRIDGVGGFRLPEVHEAALVARAAGMPPGIYWTRTSDEGFGERSLVWSNIKYRATPIHEGYAGAHYLCVRGSEPRPTVVAQR